MRKIQINTKNGQILKDIFTNSLHSFILIIGRLYFEKY